MKVIGIIGAAALSLLLGIAGPVYALQDQQDEKKGHLKQSLEGYPRFQYGGYWITTVDPWPGYWGMTGTTTTTFISSMLTTATTCTTRGIPASESAISISM